jgi:hypothetical protein
MDRFQGPRVDARMRAWISLGCLAGLALVASITKASGGSPSAAGYPLDDIPRVMEPGSALPCQVGNVPLVEYRGEHLKYQKATRIHPAFRAQLAAFERVVSEVATTHYARAPRQIVHLGTYNCRVMRRYPSWVSEHALGNAIDIAGFDFAPLPRASARRADLPAALRGSFRVRVDTHWKAKGALAAHAAFLHDLAHELATRPEVFRVLLGPGYPGHHNHFHLDHAPYRVVDFEGAP